MPKPASALLCVSVMPYQAENLVIYGTTEMSSEFTGCSVA
jgi:hypothetical protein